MTIDEMIDHIDGQETPATEAQVKAFEQEIGCALPADYRDFLLRCTGSYGESLGLNENIEIELIGTFLEEGNLLAEREYFNNPDNPQIPDELIWIMGDAFGNAFCLAIKGDEIGKVYFYDHEYDMKEPEALEPLGDSFTDFVSKLNMIEVEELD